MELLEQDDSKHDLLRQLTIPEEDKAGFIPSSGYRWFRSTNIICIEKARRLRQRA
jgi:hypothetical protein